LKKPPSGGFFFGAGNAGAVAISAGGAEPTAQALLPICSAGVGGRSVSSMYLPGRCAWALPCAFNVPATYPPRGFIMRQLSKTQTQTSRFLPKFRPDGGDDENNKPPRNPTSLESSHRHEQMLAKKLAKKESPVRLTGSVNSKRQFEIMSPEGFAPVLWSAEQICLETSSGQK
jgi:hypothetical protein